MPNSPLGRPAAQEFGTAALMAVWTAWSTMFVVGAAGENARSFGVAFYSAGTVLGLLLFVLFVARGLAAEVRDAE